MSPNSRSAEEAKADHIHRMGEDLGTIYDALWQQIAWVHTKWHDYVELFATKESRVDLLNKAAPSFFRLVQDSLWENTLLHIARLTDPPTTGKKQNLTIQRLPRLVGHEPTRAKVQELVSVALSTSEFARDWRNRHIAHSDLDLSVSDTAKPLEFASHQCVHEALEALVNVLNAVSLHYLETTNFFDIADGDGFSLLYVIDDGLTADNLRRERLARGEYNPSDVYRHRDL